MDSSLTKSYNNNDSRSSSDTSGSDEAHVSIPCEETSVLFDGVNHAFGSTSHSNSPKVQLCWRQVSYTVETRVRKFPSLPLYTRGRKQILSSITGRIESRSLTALIGPSGAGKSSLLEILAGRRERGVSGSIVVRYESKKQASRTKIAFMAQRDVFCAKLTVRETLIFASKLKNYTANARLEPKTKSQAKAKGHDPRIVSLQESPDVKNLHHSLASEIMEELSLSSCADVTVCNCSGGQQKRLSIACELVSRPDILLLDEPTSGLG